MAVFDKHLTLSSLDSAVQFAKESPFVGLHGTWRAHSDCSGLALLAL